MKSRDELIAQIEIFESLELKAQDEYALLERELADPELRKIAGAIRLDEVRHAAICREIIELLQKGS